MTTTTIELKVWKTIKLGRGLKTADYFLNALKYGLYKIDRSVNVMLGKLAFTPRKTEKEVDLVNVSVKELGFKDGATLRDIHQRAIESGLELCPPEVGPQLRLQCHDQSRGECLHIAMKPISIPIFAASNRQLLGFSVGNWGSENYLGQSDCDPDRFLAGHLRFAFVLRRK